MPRKKYRLRPYAPHSVEVDWHGDWENIRVFFNGESLGAIQDKPSLINGSTFTLGRQSYLDITLQKGFFRDRLALFWNGTPLPGTTADPRRQLRMTSTFLLAIGLLFLTASALLFLFKQHIGLPPIAPQVLGLASLLPIAAGYSLLTFRRKTASLMLLASFFELLFHLATVFWGDSSWSASSIIARLLLLSLLARGICLIEDIYELRRRNPGHPLTIES